MISWPWEITFVPLWIVLCVSLVGVLYTIIFAGILLRMPEVNAEQRRTSTNSALGKVTKNMFFYTQKGKITGERFSTIAYFYCICTLE